MKNLQLIRKILISREKWAPASTILILFAMLITACAQQPVQYITPTAQPPVQPTVTSTSPGTTSDMAIAAAESILTDQFMGASVDIQLIDIQSVDWPDSCLGVTQSGIVCAMHVVSGYR